MKTSEKAQQNSGADSKMTFRLTPDLIKDKGKTRLGGQGPVFRMPSIEDKDKVRLGGQGPIFRK